MAKPSTKPQWLNGITAVDPTVNVSPTAGKRDAGWATQERPPAQYLNWLFYWIHQWILYVDTITAEALTWTAAQTWNAASLFVGIATFQNDVEFQDSVHISGTGGKVYTHVDTIKETVPATFGRTYAGTAWTDAADAVTYTGVSPGTFLIPLPVKVHDRIVAVKLHFFLSTATASAISYKLVRYNASAVASDQSDVMNAAASTAMQNLAATNVNTGAANVAEGERWYVLVTGNASSLTRTLCGATVGFSRPI